VPHVWRPVSCKKVNNKCVDCQIKGDTTWSTRGIISYGSLQIYLTLDKTSRTFIWGGRSQLRIAIIILSVMGRKPDYVYDPTLDKMDFNIDGKFTNKPNLKSEYLKLSDAFYVAIGGNHGEQRCEIANELELTHRLTPLSLQHPKSYICQTAEIGRGLMAMPGSIIHSHTKIGNFCIVNTNASVDHECEIGHGVHIMGGSVVTGRVKIDDYATIGSNATILPDLHIGKGSFVGAGAVVTRDVKAGEIVVGIPAKPRTS